MEKTENEKKQVYHPLAQVIKDEEKVFIDGREYELIENVRNAFDVEVLKEKYDPFLNQYDYLVGDVSSEHLRLKGFYDSQDRAPIDKKANVIVDYLEEYCNPGSPYFILHLVEQNAVKKIVLGRKNTQHKKQYRSSKKAHNKNNFKDKKVHRTRIRKNAIATRKKNRSNRKNSFVIKKRKS
ncbi:DUF1027 domain-containing protein [Lactobacillus sp. PV037]|uniref:YutD family protein n=1 Tax=unclassified Lactobacillus TaxID=2620435 RepID=UPI00224088B4|nr:MULTISPECIES: YutD family protein [unclassified Lactobacillus]QNQ81929.1 DUF1027 domain-containing protein [Lactobacillus sp. PV012]QNQ84035.1 DUF1027 domain-containing protein [Lactobacillus sp. PV037]